MKTLVLELPESRSYVRLNSLGDCNEVPTECTWRVIEGTTTFGYRNRGSLRFEKLSKEKRDRILEEYNKTGILPRIDIYEETLRVYFGINRVID